MGLAIPPGDEIKRDTFVKITPLQFSSSKQDHVEVPGSTKPLL